ncbi:MAG: histidine phosphatase family protein [Burkholderiales bacterium]
MHATRLTFTRRAATLIGAALLFIPAFAPAQSGSEAAWQALKGGAIVLLRHANAPGVGDPPGFKLEDCATQRNVDADGQAQALAIGKAFAAHGVTVGAVWSSAWCRAKETAGLAFPGKVRLEPMFNSVFGDKTLESVKTPSARDLLLGWSGPGALVVVSHQVNIQALTGVAPRAGEGVVVKAREGRVEVVGRIEAPVPGAR